VYVLVKNSSDQKIASYLAKGLIIPPVISTIPTNKLVEFRNVIYYKTNISYQGLPFGTVTIGYSLKTLDTAIRQLRETALYFCVCFFLIGIILSVIISNMITGGIRKLEATVKAESKGAGDTRVSVTSNDEIGKLGRAFNLMLHRLDMSRRDLVRYSEQLKKQNDELNQFSYVVSHDLKAPLRAIFKLSEWIEEDMNTVISEESRKNMQTLRTRVFRLEGLINGLLEYSKIGRMNVKMENVDVMAMLKEIIDLLNPPAHIKINIQEEMPMFKTKRVLLQQVFINLISNAIKYNNNEVGIINIRVNEADEFYEFIVEDNGMGIAPAYHKKVFEIFQTLESRDKVEGTGVGLALIKKCVDDIGGTIALESSEGKGAQFTFTWPKEKTVTENSEHNNGNFQLFTNGKFN
jgi:signal transduction histidine kinase